MASFLFYLVICLAVLGTGWVILAARQTNRDFRAVTQAKCISCGVGFGADAAKKAEAEAKETSRIASDENPGWLVSSTREWPVECPACGSRHKYLPDKQEILAE